MRDGADDDALNGAYWLMTDQVFILVACRGGSGVLLSFP